MIQFRFGARMPVKGIHSIESYVIWQRYRAFVKSSILTNIPPIMFGTAYDYFQQNEPSTHPDLKPRSLRLPSQRINLGLARSQGNGK